MAYWAHKKTTLILLIAFCGCSTESTSEVGDWDKQSVKIALNWFAEAEHGGFIAAKELGIFEAAGLKAAIVQGGPGAPTRVLQELATGRIQFGVSNADMIVAARAKGVPLVAIAAPLQQSPRCIMVHQSSGFESLKDIQAVELAINESKVFAQWMIKQLPLSDVTMVPFNGGVVGEFIRKPNFAQQAYVFSEPFTAEEKGGDPKVLMLNEIGFNPYSSILVTTEEMIRENPDRVRTVVECCVEGWRRYLEDPRVTNEAINRDNSDMSLESLEYGVESMRPLCKSDSGLCQMSLERWAQLITLCESVGEIDSGSVDPAECFDNSFIPTE